jgi:uncharacterized protein YoxC
MESINIISAIAEIVLYLGLSVFAVFAIIYFRKISESISSIEERVNSIAISTGPAIDEISAIASDIREISRKSKLEIHRLEMLTDELIKRGYEINDTIKFIQDKISCYFNNGSNFISALLSGFTAFKRKIN